MMSGKTASPNSMMCNNSLFSFVERQTGLAFCGAAISVVALFLTAKSYYDIILQRNQ